MSILTAADLQSTNRQVCIVDKGAGSTGAHWNSVGNAAGNPSSLGLNPGNAANGIVPVDGSAFGIPVGYPNVQFGSGSGFINWIEYSAAQAATRFYLFDRLFYAGKYAFNAATVLAAQPSFAGRVPNGDYSGLQIWAEIATATTGTLSVTVTYTDQDGNAGATTGAVAMPSTAQSACLMLPLAAGDCGVQLIESVTGTVASVGEFNIFIARPLAIFAARTAQGTMYTKSFEQLCMPEVYPTSALAYMQEGQSSQLFMTFEIASK